MRLTPTENLRLTLRMKCYSKLIALILVAALIQGAIYLRPRYLPTKAEFRARMDRDNIDQRSKSWRLFDACQRNR